MTETSDTALVVTEARSTRSGRDLAIRVFVTAADLAVWFWTQSLIGARGLVLVVSQPARSEISCTQPRVLRISTAPVHGKSAADCKFGSHQSAGALSLVAMGIQKGKRAARPFLGLVIVLGLRQITQALVSLPALPNAIWHYPGFPSLRVTYGVANDYFYSGIRRSQSWLRRKSLAWADAGSPGWRCSSLSLRA